MGLTSKRKADGSLDRLKARIVAKGFKQRPGFDYMETFAPTTRMATIRLILALSAIEDLELHSVDISHAFINGDIDAEIYMKQPEGFHQGNADTVCHLKKSLYGLKQAARCWNQKLHSALQSMGFKRLQSDASIYVYAKESVRIIMPIWVDDITLASNDKSAMEETVDGLKKHFKL